MTNRTLIAFLIAPLAPFTYVLVAFKLMSSNWGGMLGVIALLACYLPTILIGIPLVGYLRRKKKLSTVNLTLLGGAAGLVVFYAFGFVIATILDSSKGLVPAIGELIGGTLLGASVAFIFGLIAGIPFYKTKL